ncbi:MAG: GNAT family N-acetyltransferase [bacterium]
MTYQIHFLSEAAFTEIYHTFQDAFADYPIDMSRVNEQSLFHRAVKNGIVFESSVGVYYQGKMVGFTLIGLDRWQQELAAFDIGTGVVREHRGKGLAQKMFEYAVPFLRAKGVRKFLLEVLQDNAPAIKAYQKAGFNITREFDCFDLKIEKYRLRKGSDAPVRVETLDREELTEFIGFLDWQPSWENSFAAIKRIPDSVLLLAALVDNEYVGLLVFYPALNWIMNLVVRDIYRRRGIASLLMNYLYLSHTHHEGHLKIVNVQSKDKGFIRFLTRCGFELYAKQFEMERDL